MNFNLYCCEAVKKALAAKLANLSWNGFLFLDWWFASPKKIEVKIHHKQTDKHKNLWHSTRVGVCMLSQWNLLPPYWLRSQGDNNHDKQRVVATMLMFQATLPRERKCVCLCVCVRCQIMGFCLVCFCEKSYFFVELWTLHGLKEWKMKCGVILPK